MRPNEGAASSQPIKYEPVSVKDVLVEMKDTSELLIDLSYSAVLHQSEDIAAEVLKLEEKMDVLEMRARMSLMMAARNPKDTEMLAPVLGVVSGAEKISNATGDIAKIVLEEMGLPEAMRAALPEAVETLVRGTIAADSEYVGKKLKTIDLESETGVRIIAIRRGDEWITNPGPKTRIEANDVTIMRGPEQSIDDVYETATGERYSLPEFEEPDVDDLERAVRSIIHMKNLSELAVDLAYGSILFDNAELAEEVHNLEVEVDALQSRFEAWTLRAAKDAEDPVSLRGLIRLGISTEVISDAALEISEGVRRDIDVHPVIELAMQESDEVISRVTVEAGSDLAGATITDGVPATDVTMSVIAIRRPDEGWMLVADTEETLQPGDVLIGKGTRTAAENFEALAGT
ncbi:potassium channel family protein [Natranaeroarchaeum aerophilus]|uniref:Potassium channel protein n=1 Tax=Natranaeroarchaeum aerophilus TaxID=2917711 RepID=A0AAE3FRD0_9EURY|nr:potassium channel family protein [Natranaeroarchaeum aerophilus]MCL9813214.1 potassium channel protein [Natranaeroarchaeum aerophilus]